MASTYVNELRLEEITTGEQAGTWGDTTNKNLELIGEALGYGTEAVFDSDANKTTTIADGSTDPVRSLYYKVTSSATLSTTRTLTLAPSSTSKVWVLENATSGSQSITVSGGGSDTVTIENGKIAMIASDGSGNILDISTKLIAKGQSGGETTATAAELNVLDQDTAATTPTLALTDRLFVHDVGTGNAQVTIANIMKLVYPVGSIYVNASVSTNPGTLLGFGTWAAFGAGKVPVGIDSSDTDFDTAEETGGAKTVTLAEANLPAHTHAAGSLATASAGAHTHTLSMETSPGDNPLGGNNNISTDNQGPQGPYTPSALTMASAGAHTHTISGSTGSTGSGTAVANVQPYIVVYMWKRTA
tara:strand:+ start:550 stop:1626 length:1077 start_codon:yes stop_codon:yes gene_type:complete